MVLLECSLVELEVQIKEKLEVQRTEKLELTSEENLAVQENDMSTEETELNIGMCS